MNDPNRNIGISPIASSPAFAPRWYVGIEVSSDRLAVAAANDNDDIQLLPTFANDEAGITQLLECLRQSFGKQILWVCCGATDHHHHNAVVALAKQGLPVSVATSPQVRYYGHSQLHRNKTDKTDAILIARFAVHQAQAGKLRRFQSKPPARQKLYERVRLLDEYQKELAAKQNREESLQDEIVKQMEREQIKRIAEAMTRLEAEIDTQCRSEAEFAKSYQLLLTIPGLDLKSAAALLAEEVDLATDKRTLCAKHGFAPSQHPVKKPSSPSPLSSDDRFWLRQVMYQPAVAAMQSNALVREFAERRRASEMDEKALVYACAHKLMLIIFGVLKNQKPFNSNILTERT